MLPPASNGGWVFLCLYIIFPTRSFKGLPFPEAPEVPQLVC